MRYPFLKNPPASRTTVDTFMGYNHNLRIPENQFYDMKNMTADHYPVLCSREKRSTFRTLQCPWGIIAKDGVCHVDGPFFYVNDTLVEGLTLRTVCTGCDRAKSCNQYVPGKYQCEKQMVSMGAYVLIFPDKVWVHITSQGDYTFGSMENIWRSGGGEVTLSLCKADGGDYGKIASTKPSGPTDGQLWMDSQTKSLKQWSESAGAWVTVSTTYVRIQGAGIQQGFSQYDGVTLSGFGSDAAGLNGAAVVWQTGEDYIVVPGLVSKSITTTDAVVISRTLPELDYATVCANRLWGCRYGEDENGNFVNEIYCSKLGDFKNFGCFMGISTDSAVLNLGSDGPFTGAITHLDHPIFFKENMLHKVYISESGAHSVTDTPCRGVQTGCHKSLAIVGETLYYKARNGICAYDGSLPAEVSRDLGENGYAEAVAGSFGSKYYISMALNGQWHLFVYDTDKRMWHKQDDLKVNAFCTWGQELYAMTDKKILALNGTVGDKEEAFHWFVQTGDIGLSMPDAKYLSRLTVRMALEEGKQATLYVRYNRGNQWNRLQKVQGQGLGSFDILVHPRRCDTMALRIEGQGAVEIYSFTKTLEKGSDRL